MKKNKLLLLPVLFFASFSTGGCANQVNKNVLRIINAEDYIYEQEQEKDEDGNPTPINMVDQFKEYYKEKCGKDISVVYDTFDTNETMLSSLKTGKTKYDLVCCSDYTLQKMVRAGLIEKICGEDQKKEDLIPNYYEYTPEYLKDIFSGIDCNTYNDDGSVKEKFGTLDEYCCGYMWGTLGLIYNPKTFIDKGICKSIEEVQKALSDWSCLWDSKFKGTIAIKDSMRDTYSIAIMKTYEKEFKALKEKHDNDELSDEEYNKQLNAIFNYGGEKDKEADKHIEEVKTTLMDLRKNIFGFEIDGGKEDIVTGKIAIDTAWSGDAVYSIDQASEEKKVDLYYSIPETGGNIWFDAWGFQKGGNKELALEFVNFVSNPLNAAQNMDYVGYTPFIAGEEIFTMVADWYDERPEEETEENSPDETSEEEEEEENLGEDLGELEGFMRVDLSKYFKLSDEDQNDYIIYVSEDAGGSHAEIFAQYPDVDRLPSLAIMEDYGNNQEKIIRMWEHIKAEGMPTWAIVLLSCEGAVIVVALIVFFGTKFALKKQRKNRRKAYKENLNSEVKKS